MEQLKGRVSGALLERIEQSDEADILSTATELAAFLDRDPISRRIIDRLSQASTCGKDQESATKNRADGNKAFQQQDYRQAIQFYTKALRLMPWDSASGKALATIFTNRATSLHKSGWKLEGLRDCDRAIALDDSYAKAWYRRGLIRSDIRDYQAAVLDMEAAYTRETTIAGKKQIELEIQQVRRKLAESSSPQSQRNCITNPSIQMTRVETETYWSSDKQWGLRTTSELVEAGTLVHSEDAAAAVLLKKYRYTHCHCCFSALPLDSLPCRECCAVLYCSEACRDSAKDEHELECGGSAWAAVLPEEAVLAARTLRLNLQLDLCHHHDKLPSHSKVELYLLSATLAKCLNSRRRISFFAELIAKLVILLSTLRYNSMGIVHIDSSAGTGNVDKADICGIEHVTVAQALFLRASKFNHSCNPNVHVSYVKRSLRAHSTALLAAFSPLEISYGAQVGESERSERINWLRDRYAFECSCDSCRLGTVSDLLLVAYNCSQPGCKGVVWDPESSVDDLLLPGSSDPPRFLIDLSLEIETDRHLPRKACLKCKTGRSRREDARKSLEQLQTISSLSGSHDAIAEGLKLLENGRKWFHRFNKQLALMEDTMARIYCEAQQSENAVSHSQNSLEILERIYGSKDHIALAYERVKLASIAKAAGRIELAATCLKVVDETFSVHYGRDYGTVFPDLKQLIS